MRPPAPVRRVLVSENSPPVKNYQRNVHNSSKKREQPPVQKTRPLRSPPSTQTLQRKVRNPIKRTASSDRKKRKAARTRRTKPILSSRFPYPKRVSRPRCAACAFAKQQTNAIPQPSCAVRTELPRAKNTPLKRPDNKTANLSQPKCQQTSVSTQDRGVLNDLPFDATSFCPAGDVPQSLQPPDGYNITYNHPSTATPKQRCRRKSPFSLCHASVLPTPLHSKCLAPPGHPIALPSENQPVSTILSPTPSSDEKWFHRVFKEYTRHQNQQNPLTREHIVDKRRSSKYTTYIPINNENKLPFEDKKPLFSKDLIDLIGDKNDERLRVLYENPTRQELQQSIMCLAGAPKKRIKTKPKKMPWR